MFTAILTATVFLPIILAGGGDMNVVALNSTTDIANANGILQNIDGVWSAVGTGIAGTVTPMVLDMAVSPDGTLYATGYFDTAGGGTVNNIAMWNGSSWAAMGAGLNGAGASLAIGPDGKVYVGGAFTEAGGTAAKRVAVWDGSAWAAVGEGFFSDYTNALAFDSAGNLYAGGVWSRLGGGGTVNHVAKWNGSAWAAMDAGVNDAVWDLAVDSSDNIYVAGSFGTIGSGTIPCQKIAMWDGSWHSLSSNTDADVLTVAYAPNGLLYAGGNFTTIGGTVGGTVSANYIASYNGSSWSALGDGLNLYCQYIFLDGNTVYASGNFTAAGGLSLADNIAQWNGSIWSALDVDLPGSAIGRGIARYGDRLYFGFDTSGTATTSGANPTAVNNTGSAIAYPTIIIKRSGGTGATLESIQNLTTGDKLYFNYALANGEEIVINCAPATKTITSSFIGNAIGKLQPNSNFATFGLIPGVNNIACYISTTGSPTITADMSWPQVYATADGT